MPDLDALEEEIARLEGETLPFRFINAYRRIVDAITPDVDKDRLQNIVARFTASLPDLPQLDDISIKAGKLDEALTLQSIGDLLTAINSRNRALSRLTAELQRQIDLGNADAVRLRRIRTALEKATSTVTAIRDLVDDLTATDATIIGNINALLTTIGNIAGTFTPDGPSSR